MIPILSYSPNQRKDSIKKRKYGPVSKMFALHEVDVGSISDTLSGPMNQSGVISLRPQVVKCPEYYLHLYA